MASASAAAGSGQAKARVPGDYTDLEEDDEFQEFEQEGAGEIRSDTFLAASAPYSFFVIAINMQVT